MSMEKIKIPLAKNIYKKKRHLLVDFVALVKQLNIQALFGKLCIFSNYN
jgi:hypothetical protein